MVNEDVIKNISPTNTNSTIIDFRNKHISNLLFVENNFGVIRNLFIAAIVNNTNTEVSLSNNSCPYTEVHNRFNFPSKSHIKSKPDTINNETNITAF